MKPQSEARQIILVRADLKMPAGKLCAQVAHASVKAITDTGVYSACLSIPITECLKSWLEGSYAKVCLAVHSEEELRELVAKAKELGMPTSIIVDEGRTVFHGEQHVTCGAIGPAYKSEVDKITGHLKLYR